jgi:hypothetical protein
MNSRELSSQQRHQHSRTIVVGDSSPRGSTLPSHLQHLRSKNNNKNNHVDDGNDNGDDNIDSMLSPSSSSPSSKLLKSDQQQQQQQKQMFHWFERLTSPVQFTLLVCGVFLFFGIHNYLQEAIMHVPGFTFGVMLGWLEVLGYVHDNINGISS